MLELIRSNRPLRGERGVTMVEYGILVAVIALVVIVGATVFGTALSKAFNDMAAAL